MLAHLASPDLLRESGAGQWWPAPPASCPAWNLQETRAERRGRMNQNSPRVAGEALSVFPTRRDKCDTPALRFQRPEAIAVVRSFFPRSHCRLLLFTR